MSERVVQTERGPVTVYVNDVVAQPPTWMLVNTLWHYVLATGIAACGFVPTYAYVVQHFRAHTKRKLHERTITTLCRRCERILARST